MAHIMLNGGARKFILRKRLQHWNDTDTLNMLRCIESILPFLPNNGICWGCALLSLSMVKNHFSVHPLSGKPRGGSSICQMSCHIPKTFIEGNMASMMRQPIIWVGVEPVSSGGDRRAEAFVHFHTKSGSKSKDLSYCYSLPPCPRQAASHRYDKPLLLVNSGLSGPPLPGSTQVRCSWNKSAEM